MEPAALGEISALTELVDVSVTVSPEVLMETGVVEVSRVAKTEALQITTAPNATKVRINNKRFLILTSQICISYTFYYT